MKKTMHSPNNILSEEEGEQLAIWCKALGHPMRVRLVDWLLQTANDEGWVCNDLVRHLPISASTASEHLRILRESGLVSREIRGNNSRYQVNKDIFEQYRALLKSL